MIDFAKPPAIIRPAPKEIIRPGDPRFGAGMVINPYIFGAGSGAWYTVKTISLNSDDNASENYTLRSRFTSLSGTGPFTQIRVTFAASTGEDLGIENAAVGIYAGSNTNTTATPTQLFFGGSNTITVTAGTTVTSDAAAFSFTHTDGLVTICDVLGTGGGMRWLNSGGQGAYGGSGANSYNSSTGGLTNASRSYAVSLIEGFK